MWSRQDHPIRVCHRPRKWYSRNPQGHRECCLAALRRSRTPCLEESGRLSRSGSGSVSRGWPPIHCRNNFRPSLGHPLTYPVTAGGARAAGPGSDGGSAHAAPASGTDTAAAAAAVINSFLIMCFSYR